MDWLDNEKLRTLTGLIAVLVGIGAVIGLAAYTICHLGDDQKDSMVAITSSAFGIVSAVVTAYLGIKATANAAGKGGEAAVARYEVRVKKDKIDRLNKEIDEREKGGEITPELATKLREASVKAEEDARRDDPLS